MMDLFETAPTFDDPLGMLRSCHRRIERALDTLVGLSQREREEGLNEGACATLRQILHYFDTGVPRHATDEEESLFPRLRRALGDQDGRSVDHRSSLAALDGLERDHIIAERAHHELASLGEALAQSGRFDGEEERVRFTALVETLRNLYREHIHREDDEILPLAGAVLDAGERDQIGAEMASRRGIDWREQREIIASMRLRPWSRRAEGRGGWEGEIRR